MRIVENEKMIKRNARIGQIATFSGLFVLIGGLIVSFNRPELSIYSFLALLLGFILSQVGLYYGARWGRKPRLDEVLSAGLKGLDARHTIYNWVTPVSHLLVGPSGVWVFVPRPQRVTVTFSKGRWRQVSAKSPLRAVGGWYMRTFAQEGIDRPDLEIQSEISKAQEYFKKILDENEIPEVQAALVLTHPEAALDIPAEESPPTPTVLLKDLKDLVRKAAKTQSLSPARVQKIQEIIEGIE